MTDCELQALLKSNLNEGAKAFNEKLDAPLSGALARLLGVRPCTLYQ